MRHRLRRGLYGSVAALGGSFTPLSLFSAGEQGFYYDPSDFSTLFQDTAGTVPVTAVGQSVARINDKSGRGNHATQSNASQQPILRQNGSLYYLEFDGTDDFLVTGTITPGVDKVQVFAGVRKLSDAASAVLLESSVSIGSNNGSISLWAPVSASPTYRWFTKGTVEANAAASGFAAPVTNVLTGIGDISGDFAQLRINGAVTGTSTTNQGTGNFLAYPLYIGRRSGTSLPFNGHIYSLIGRFGPNLTTAQIEAVERWVANKTGVTI